MHSMYLAGVPLFWSMSATDPLGAWRHSDLVTSTVVADRCANSVSTVTQIITGLGRVVAAGVADAVVDGVMPIVIVISHYPVPAAVVRFKRVMRPTLTSIGARHHNILPVESERPYIRRMRVNDSRLDRLRRSRLQRRISRRAGLRKRILNVRIALDACHVRPSFQHLGNLTAALH